MQTTQQLLQQLKGQRFTLCTNCNKSVIRTGATVRQLEDDLIEVGEACPNCDYWYHFYFINSELQNDAPKPADGRKERRDYQMRVKRFNKKMRAKLGMKKIRGTWRRSERKVVNEPA